VIEEGRGGPTSKITTGWDLREFNRTDGTPEEQERRKRTRAEDEQMWEEAAAVQGTVVGTKEGVVEEARWIRDTAASILDKIAKPRRVCMRSKRWWNEEIAELREDLGKARRADRHHRTSAPRPHEKPSGDPSERQKRPAGTPSWRMQAAKTFGRRQGTQIPGPTAAPDP